MLKISYESKDDIPKGAESFYIEKDGVFTLNAEIPDTSKLEGTLDRERKLRREAEAKVKDYDAKYGLLPEDFTLDEYNRLKDSGGGDIEKKLQEQRERINAQHKKEMEKLQSELAEKDGLVHTHIKTAALHKAINEANIAKAFIPAVEAMMASRIKVEGVNVFLDEKPVNEALKSWAQSEEGKHYVSAAANSGGGANGRSGSGNAKTVTRAEFDAFSQSERMQAAKDGVKVVD